MPVYIYKAVTKNGLIVKNRVEELNKQLLVKKLKDNKLTPIDIVQVKFGQKNRTLKKKNISTVKDIAKNIDTTTIVTNRKSKKISTMEKIENYIGNSRKITQRDLVVFTENFYLLKKANFNNIHALSTIIQSTENPTLREVLEDILAGLEAGDYMYTTMEYYETVFPYIYINMIKVGELSGSLTKSLKQAVEYLDDTEHLNKRLRSILIPNLIQFFGLLAMLIVGTLFAIPAIQSVFDAVGTKDTLPAITLWFADFLDAAVAMWYIPVAVIALITAAIVFYINTPKGKYNYHLFKYRMPIFGKLIYLIDFNRLMKAMLLNLQNGMRIQDALEVSKNVAQNFVMLSIIETSINNILIGSSWIDPFENAGLSSPMIIEMLKIGMQTDLPEMMEKLLEYIQIDIDNTLEKIMKVLPQVVYVIVGAVLIFFVIVVLVPCIQVYMGNFLFSAYGY